MNDFDPPVFHKCERLIYYTLRLLNIPQPYEDYYQEAYLIYQKTLERHNPSRSKFFTYFIHALYRHFQTCLRNEQRDREISLADGDWIDSCPLEEPLFFLDLHYYSDLTPVERQIVQYAYDGFTIKETAEHLDVSPSTINRARKRLKHKLLLHMERGG